MKTLLPHIAALALLVFVGHSTATAQNCNASFTYDASDCPNIHFTATATADTTIICWMFDYQGAGNIDWCEHADNKFDANGAYPVCLGIMTADGCTDMWCDTIYINCVCIKPDAGYSYSTNELEVNFTDTSITANTFLSWNWDFGDGTTSSQQSPTHTYSAPGTYMACLTVEDTCDTKSVCKWVTVACAGPVADFNYSANILTVDFTDNCSGTPDYWFWDFDDGSTSNLQNPTYTYSQPGTFNVCMTAASICDTSVHCEAITVINTGIYDENYHSLQVPVFSTPIEGQYQLNLDAFAGTQTSIEVIDMHGKKVQQLNPLQPISGQLLHLDLSMLAKGIYAIRIRNANIEGVAKVLR